MASLWRLQNRVPIQIIVSQSDRLGAQWHTEDEEDASDTNVQDLGVFPQGGAHAAEPGASSDRPSGLDDKDDEGVKDLGVFSSQQRGCCTD